MQLTEAQELTKDFKIKRIVEIEENKAGNINSTYCLIAEDGTRYILQMINKHVFTRTAEVMENITNVSAYLEKQVLQEGGDPQREVLYPTQTTRECYFYCYRWRTLACI